MILIIDSNNQKRCDMSHTAFDLGLSQLNNSNQLSLNIMKLVAKTLVVLTTSTIFLGGMFLVTCMVMYPPHYIESKAAR